MSAKSLKCENGSGAIGVWEGSKVKVVKDNYNASIVFDSIDLTAGKARMIGEIGAVNVIVFATGSGLSFIEQTGTRNLHFTTVFRICISFPITTFKRPTNNHSYKDNRWRYNTSSLRESGKKNQAYRHRYA